MTLDPAQLEADLLARPAGTLAERLPARFVAPRYGGRSLLNLPPTVGQLLGQAQGWVAPPLEESLWQPLAEGVQRVALLLVDGVGWRRLWEVVARQDAALPDLLARWGAVVFPITSVSPATTSVATTTLWGDGSAPTAHGMVGYTFLLAEFSALCNLLYWKPIGRRDGGVGDLLAWGVEPESFLPTPSIAQRLAAGGVATTALMPGGITRSPLSRAQLRGARVVGFRNSTDLWLKLRAWLAADHRGRAYCYAYYPDFDSFSHQDGPAAPSWEALWRTFRFHLDQFLETLPGAARAGTLLLVTADHGHVFARPERRHLLGDHPHLMRHLAVMPGGEPRHLYLYARAGHRAAIRDYHAAYLADDFHLLDAQEALRAGLYGPPGRLHPDVERRLGDWVLLAKGEATLWNQPPDEWLLGMHGSLEPEEMLVPFVALRLDA